jgi:perosamine synthetase
MRAEGIGVQVHYLPVYHHPYYRRLGYARGLCPVAERHAAATLSLPLFPTLTEDDQDRVVDTLRRCLYEADRGEGEAAPGCG